MEDITEDCVNFGVPQKDRTYTLRLSRQELLVIRGLAQHPHSVYRENPVILDRVNKLYHEMNAIVEYERPGLPH